MKKKVSIFDFFNILVMFLITVVTLYPMLYVLFASFSNPTELMKNSGFLYKSCGFSLDGYKAVFTDFDIIIGYKNTIINTVLGTFLSLLATLLLAFPLSRKKMYNSKLIMKFIVVTMYFSGGLIPLYLVVRQIGLLNTRWSMILPILISSFNLIVMRNACEAIPDAMEESAIIDGANEWTVLFKIYVPLLKATIAVLALYYSSYYWNSWLSAVLYVRKRELYPLQLILREILIEQKTNEMVLDAGAGKSASLEEVVNNATIVVATIPMLAVYPFIQKYFTKGIMVGAVKG